MRRDYTHEANGLVQSVTYGNGASVHYSYDPGNRVTQIEHRDAGGGVMLALDYDYYPNDLPSSIAETGSTVGVGITITTTFAYDRLRRLTQEQRCRGTTSCDLLYYSREYFYDKGGNRLSMEADDELGHRLVVYHYDVDPDVNPPQASNPYGSFNNRLEWSETLDISSGVPPYPLLATTWYYYSAAGNVTRIVSDPPRTGGGEYAASMASGTVETTEEGGVEAMALVGGGGDSSMALAGPGVSCVGTNTLKYTATRFEYAKNGETATYVLGEQWCWDGVSTDQNCGPGPILDPTTNYKVLWAREFRYDGARARYMNAPLDPATMRPYNTTEKPTVWSDYDGDEIYGDFEMVSGSPINKRSFEPGIGRTANPLTTPVTDYYHGDMLGTTRLMSNSSGSSIEPAVYTAFGERISAPTITDGTRYGYVGAWGYQQNAEFPYLHVGARYYDPSSGRFLQRDPIGIIGGLNVYGYLDQSPPTDTADPDGLDPKKEEPELIPKPHRKVNPKKAKEIEEFVEGACGGKEHKKGKRKSTKDQHQDGEARKQKDKFGGEKGDERRPYRRKIEFDDAGAVGPAG